MIVRFRRERSRAPIYYGDPDKSKGESMADSMGYGRMATEPEKPSSSLLGSILVTLFCCFPLGLVAVVYGILVHTRWGAGDQQGARRAADMAERWMYASVGVAVLLFIAGLLYRFVFRRFAG